MMRPLAIQVAGFRGWTERVELKLERPITAIVAENGRGKSSTLNALEWCLFGEGICGKTSSGIDERSGWELRPRAASSAPTEVRLVLATDEGEWTVTRRAAAGSAKGGGDLEIRLADGAIVSGRDAELRLRRAGAPDWETYRRAHCFHQEAARTRVVEINDRSAVLAKLLGLDADVELRAALEAHKAKPIIAAIDDELEGLASHIESVRGRPRRDMADIEARLARSGIERAHVSEGRTLQERSALLREARELAAALGLTPAYPDVSSGRAVLEWARAWPQEARAGAPALARLPALRADSNALRTAIDEASQHEEAWVEARRALENEARSGGHPDARSAALETARDRVADAKAALANAGRRLALLCDALDVLGRSSGGGDAGASEQAMAGPHGADPSRCPVCDTRVNGLVGRLKAEIARLQTAETAALQASVAGAENDRETAQRALDAYVSRSRAVDSALRRREETRAKLARQLEGIRGAGGARATDATATDPVAWEAQDVLAAARKVTEALERETSALEALASRRDSALQRHAQGCDRLADLEAWLDAARRADSQVDFESLPQWAALQSAIDEAAGFAADLEALAEMAREAQEERSALRESEVNAALGEYYAAIVGGESVAGVRVKTKRSGQRITYDLVDAADRPAVPVLNQASINALSLALLFAQAEEEARRGGFACVVLDDPAQSLDAERQAGLARAIEKLSASCAVLLGLLPGAVVERLRRYVSAPRRLVYLGPWDATHGASVGMVEDL